MSCLARRSAWLFAFYAVLSAAPIATVLVPMSIAFLPLMWLAAAPMISSLMLLTLWAGLGTSGLRLRMLALLVGLMYLSFWPTVLIWLQIRQQVAIANAPMFSPAALAKIYFETLVQYVGLGVVLAGMFAIVRRWFQLRIVAEYELPPPRKMQFSVFHLLMLMSALAIVLTLVRGARGTGNAETGVTPSEVAAYILIGVTIFANTACAAYAALGAGAVRRNCLLVIFTSLMLGIAFAMAARHETFGLLTFATGVLAMASPTFLVLASLLWLRPCGLRFVRRSIEPRIA